MNILIPTIGTRGDVQPFIALAKGLGVGGHRVTLMSHPCMAPLVQAYGVNFAPMGPDIDLGQETAAIHASTGNVVLGLIRVMRFAFKMLEQVHPDILAGCQEADLVVVPASSAAGKNEADLLGLPYLSVNLMPWSIPVDDPARPGFLRVTYKGLNALVGLITTRPLNRIRRRLGLSPVGPEGFTSPHLDLVPVSPHVFPPDAHWAPHHRLVGYWFLDEPSGWQPSPGLEEFLNQGEPPLVISLGAMGMGAEETYSSTRLFVDAIREAGARAIIQGWRAGLACLNLPASIYPAGPIPHSWLLPRSGGVVHHGGFGTTAAGLRAGVPGLVIPHIADQFFWGNIVHTLGVGPAPIPRGKLTGEKLALALQTLSGNEGLRTTADQIGAQIRTEEGVSTAVRAIEAAFF